MHKVKRDARIKIVHAMCDCGGEFLRDNPAITLATYPPQYPHTCLKCGKVENLSEIYPKIEYAEIDDDHKRIRITPPGKVEECPAK